MQLINIPRIGNNLDFKFYLMYGTNRNKIAKKAAEIYAI